MSAGSDKNDHLDEVEAVEEVEAEWERKRRLAQVFGDVLPDTTSDERDAGRGAADSTSDAWLRAQVPPHHGG